MSDAEFTKFKKRMNNMVMDIMKHRPTDKQFLVLNEATFRKGKRDGWITDDGILVINEMFKNLIAIDNKP